MHSNLANPLPGAPAANFTPAAAPTPAPGQQNGRVYTDLEKAKHIIPLALLVLAAVGCLALFPIIEGTALIAACVIGVLCAAGSGIYFGVNAAFFQTMPTLAEKKK